MTVKRIITSLQKQIIVQEALLSELEQLSKDWPDVTILHVDTDKPGILIDGLVTYVVFHELHAKVERRTSKDYPWRISIPGKTGTVVLYDYLDEDQFHYYFHSMGLEGEVKTNEET